MNFVMFASVTAQLPPAFIQPAIPTDLRRLSMATPSTGNKMTPRERLFAAVTMSQLPDQVPVVPLLMTRGIKEGGITVDTALRDGVASAHAKIKSRSAVSTVIPPSLMPRVISRGTTGT